MKVYRAGLSNLFYRFAGNKQGLVLTLQLKK